MTYKDDDIIYILTTEDVNNVARDLHIRRPGRDQYRFVRKYIERLFAEGPLNWHDAIADALSEMPEVGTRSR